MRTPPTHPIRGPDRGNRTVPARPDAGSDTRQHRASLSAAMPGYAATEAEPASVPAIGPPPTPARWAIPGTAR